MEVIPVIDILDGKVVHGIQGERESYKPIKSVLTDSCQPLEVAKSFKDKLSLKDLYIADLDSIEGKGDNFDIIRDIKNQLDVKIMLDYVNRNSVYFLLTLGKSICFDKKNRNMLLFSLNDEEERNRRKD